MLSWRASASDVARELEILNMIYRLWIINLAMETYCNDLMCNGYNRIIREFTGSRIARNINRRSHELATANWYGETRQAQCN